MLDYLHTIQVQVVENYKIRSLFSNLHTTLFQVKLVIGYNEKSCVVTCVGVSEMLQKSGEAA